MAVTMVRGPSGSRTFFLPPQADPTAPNFFLPAARGPGRAFLGLATSQSRGTCGRQGCPLVAASAPGAAPAPGLPGARLAPLAQVEANMTKPFVGVSDLRRYRTLGGLVSVSFLVVACSPSALFHRFISPRPPRCCTRRRSRSPGLAEQARGTRRLRRRRRGADPGRGRRATGARHRGNRAGDPHRRAPRR